MLNEIEYYIIIKPDHHFNLATFDYKPGSKGMFLADSYQLPFLFQSIELLSFYFFDHLYMIMTFSSVTVVHLGGTNI